jgi:hypothetical protein
MPVLITLPRSIAYLFSKTTFAADTSVAFYKLQLFLRIASLQLMRLSVVMKQRYYSLLTLHIIV